MENTLTFQNNAFWNKLGKWQFLAAVLTLTTFFIALHFTSDKKIAFDIVVAIITAYIIIDICAYNKIPLFASVLFLISVALIVYILVTTIVIVTTTTFFTAAFITFIIIAAIIAIAMVSISLCDATVDVKVVCLSFAAEFAVILLPMLLV